MREIKFRAWDKKSKKMRQVTEIVFNTGFYNETNDNSVKLIWVKGLDIIENKEMQIQRENDFILMQYTGLKDKNRVEIYEGDIVKKLIWNELKFETEGDGQDYSYAEVRYIDELSGFHLVNKDNKILWELAQDKYNIEVCGNRYEDSELLKE